MHCPNVKAELETLTNLQASKTSPPSVTAPQVCSDCLILGGHRGDRAQRAREVQGVKGVNGVQEKEVQNDEPKVQNMAKKKEVGKESSESESSCGSMTPLNSLSLPSPTPPLTSLPTPAPPLPSLPTPAPPALEATVALLCRPSLPLPCTPLSDKQLFRFSSGLYSCVPAWSPYS